MKSLLKLFTLLLLIGGIAACGNGNATDEASTEEGSAPTKHFTMTALVDSAAWTSKSVDTREESGTIYITGTAADGSQIILELGERPSIGIFSMRRGSMQAGTYITKEGTKYYAPFAGTSGVINVTEYVKDSILKADFSFSASNTMDLHLIEGGAFVAPLAKDAAAPAL